MAKADRKRRRHSIRWSLVQLMESNRKLIISHVFLIIRLHVLLICYFVFLVLFGWCELVHLQAPAGDNQFTVGCFLFDSRRELLSASDRP